MKPPASLNPQVDPLTVRLGHVHGDIISLIRKAYWMSPEDKQQQVDTFQRMLQRANDIIRYSRANPLR